MDLNRFWRIVAEACRSDSSLVDEWDGRLVAELVKLAAGEIVEWDRTFDRLTSRAYTVDLWGAAYLINGGASDDGFYDFRCWLVGMGRDVFEAALDTPDTLADVVTPGPEAEAEIYAAGFKAWRVVTGQPDNADYPVKLELPRLLGEDWDFEDDDQVRRRLPRLAALYLDDEP